MQKVAIMMGSDSDLGIMKAAGEVLEEFGVEYCMRILSAHRTPDQTTAFAKAAAAEGFGAIIAGAGGAAHLAGVIASETTLPVIAVPILGASLSGLDSLLSMVQMPSGIPVACVGVGAARNAGILAVQILSLSDAALREKMKAYKARMVQQVLDKDNRLQQNGWRNY
ncbi:MAG TPA: 5-(carboxyamino)imidazole ribonucleotide mutase [Firmicutes bacterium]|jgi:5-(carboxyamino)imidazole ribonucleotide mutase|nr:5-(carboxyamino)imidazole ribonucleotide mutase [Bacillota bacterium]HAZ21565.1 5-(carboxyamino)imidazole ribonucleotide mutase [Bacillota bacterium]HBG44737.1 5-(carboxyamino)imidazole ribonucleotide mutase [Bacillota bacterium]HBL51314.1 5-(carboxyamino)imidazole ribonucleotide mutase [Bacillota bacterium]HBL69108.1 5-(carboxyamino)imidazole ribonucleotide mutase [Bacillota bacterium]